MSDCASTAIVRACAIIANTVVPYRRVGRGQPVLLLASAAAQDVELSDAPRDLCVIVPEGLPQAPAFNPWLALFLDTLGIQDVSIVALGNVAGLAREFAAMEPDRVRRVLSIRDGESPLAVADVLRSIAGFTVADAPFDF
jgi:pimeloyl-ACP methyl ester carboxylesterase